MHVALTGETAGYYADFEPLGALAKVCEKGFFHDGTYSSFRGRDHGVPIDTDAMPTWRLVVCSQNHDQIGNRAVGDRLTEALDDDQLACAALLTLAGPFTPMLFQGEEWASLDAVPVLHLAPRAGARDGDRRGADQGVRADGLGPRRRARPAGPGDVRAVEARLVRARRADGTRGCSTVYRQLAALRRSRPELTDPAFGSTSCSVDEEARLFRMRRGSLEVVVNFADADTTVDLDGCGGLLFATGDGVALDGTRLALAAHAGALVDTAS